MVAKTCELVKGKRRKWRFYFILFFYFNLFIFIIFFFIFIYLFFYFFYFFFFFFFVKWIIRLVKQYDLKCYDRHLHMTDSVVVLFVLCLGV